MIIYQPFIMTLLFVEALILLFAVIALFYAVQIAMKFDENLLVPAQYKLAQRSYLVSTIVKFILLVKIPLFLFFIWSLDEISDLLPGAMCAVGVIDATHYGAYLLFIKVINLFLLSGWIYLNLEDYKTKTCKFTKLKFKFYIFVFAFVLCEIILEYMHFFSIRTDEIVECCSELFKTADVGASAFYHKNSFIVGLFYGFFVLFLLSGIFKRQVFFGVISAIFMLVCIYAIIRFFSPYIYELPRHKCPFCMLEAEYFYVGYLIYSLIFLGTVGGVYAIISKFLNIKFEKSWYYLSMAANLLLVALLSGYAIVYYIKNGVWL